MCACFTHCKTVILGVCACLTHCKTVTLGCRETCRNWFYKIASIRELLPRIYMEICILKAYQFLYGNTIYEKACTRLAKMTRGIGNPLVAAYARAYLARRGLEVLPMNKDYLSICFNDQVAALVVQVTCDV